MRLPIAAGPRTHLRLSSPLMPALVCLLAGGSLVPRSAAAIAAQAVTRQTGEQIIPVEDVVKHAPGMTDPNAWYNLGIAYLNKKQYKDAIAAFTRSYDLQPNANTLFHRALASYYLGESGDVAAYAQAEEDARAALALNADYPETTLLKADTEYAEKKYAVATADYDVYVAMPGVSAENKMYAQKRMLQSNIDSKDFAGAIEMATALIERKPLEAQNYFIRGTAYIAMRKFEPAISDLLKYTGMKSDNSMGWYNLGIAYSGQHNPADAALSYEKASTVKPDNYDAAEQAGIAYESLADAAESDIAKCAAEYDNAIQMYDRAAKMPSITPKQRSDALYNEAAAIEAKARRLHSPGLLAPAIDVWGRWLQLASADPELTKIKQHVIELQAKVSKER